MHVQRLIIFCVCLASNSKNILQRKAFNNKKAAKPSKLKFRFKVQVPTIVNELTLSVYNFLICYQE